MLPRTPHLIILLLTVLLLVAYRGYALYGHFGFDDLHYAGLAADLLRGSFDTANHYTYRLGLLLPLAASYALFGVNDLASALPSLAATGLTLYLFYWHFRREAAWQLLLALGLYVSLHWNVFYADKIMPAAVLTASVFLAWTLYVKARHRHNRSLTYGTGAALALFFAFNTKGTVVLLVPLLLTYFLLDLRHRHGRRWWLGCVGTGLLLFSGYFIVTAAWTGNAFARFTAVGVGTYFNDCSYGQLPTEALVGRLTTGFWRLLVDNWLVIYPLCAAVALAVASRRKTGRRPRVRFWMGTLFLCLGCMNFMTISVEAYNPICLDARHVLFFSPILAVCLVRILARSIPAERLRQRPALTAVGLVVATLVLLWPVVEFAVYAKGMKYRKERAGYREVLANLPAGSFLYGSAPVVNYGRYFTSFGKRRPDLSFAQYQELPPCGILPDSTTILMVNNWYMDWHGDLERSPLDEVVAARGYRYEVYPSPNERFSLRRLRCIND